MKKCWSLIAALAVLWLCPSAFGAGSTIDPTQPVYGALMSSTPIRNNFASAFNDINNLIGINNGSTAPSSPVLGQYWLNTSVTPYVMNVWDGSQWVLIGDLNSSTHNWGLTCAQMPQLSYDLVSIGHSCAMTVQSINGVPISLGGAFTLNGVYAFTGTLTGTTSITFPTSGTLATVSQITGGLPATTSLYKGTGTAGAAVAAVAGTDFVQPGGPLGTPSSGTATNLTGTASGLTVGAVSGETFPSSGIIVGTTDTQTLTNKTLVAPNLGTPSAINLANATGTPSAINLTNGTNYPPCTSTTAGVVPTPPNNTTTFLRGDCSWASAGGTASNFVVKTSAYTASANDYIYADTSGGAFTITLPSSASQFATICILDSAGAVGTNTLTIANNGLNIMGLAQSMTVTTNGASFCLTYYTSTTGWRVR